MRIAYINKADSPSVISATTVITGYPTSNMQTERLSETFRSSTLSNLIIKVNLVTAQTVTVGALAGHNLTSSATVTFSCTYSEPVLYSERTEARFFTASTYNNYIVTESGNKLITESSNYIITGTSASVIQNCYFEITDASNPNGYIEIGRIWVGEYIDINPSSLLDFTVNLKSSDKVVHTKGRQKFAITKSNWRRFELKFPISNYTMVKKIEDMYDSCGNYKSILFCNFDDIRGTMLLVEPCYVVLEGDINFYHNEMMKFSYDLNFEEVR